MATRYVAALAFAFGSLVACRAPVTTTPPPALPTPTAPVPPPWTSTLDRDLPLVGKVWQPATAAMVEPSAVLAACARADFVLLGEKHDNPDHHRLQANAIAALVHAGRKPAVLLEMLEPDSDAVVARYRATPGAAALGLGAAVGWDRTGWPPWPTYLPIAEVAFDAGLPLLSANLAHDDVRSIARHGKEGVDAETSARLGLDRPMPAPLEASLEEELRGSHCGQLPEAMVAPMALAQRARDGQMAARLIGAPGPAVLIAGAGHTRTDRGVPQRLAALRPGAAIVSVAFVEVEAGLPTPAAYAARFNASSLPFDFVWFTPRANDDDPCADFHMHKR